MRTTVDIPDPIYRALKSRAAAEGGTVKQLLVRGAEVILNERTARPVKRLSQPLLSGGEPGSLELTNEMIYDLLDLS